jgi:PAS domain S-box-containing protein
MVANMSFQSSLAGKSSLAVSTAAGLTGALLAAVVTVFAQPVLDKGRFLVFIVGVVAASIYAGAMAGVICTAISAVVIASVVMPPLYSFHVASLADFISLGLFIVSGVLVTMLATSRRTARARLQVRGRELRLAEDVFRLIVESVVDYAIFMLDVHGKILTWNAGAERIKGYQAEEIIGESFQRFYGDDDIRAGVPQKVLEAAGRDGHYQVEGWRIRKDGSCFWANVVITALRDEHGTLKGFAKVVRDLTERKRAEQTLQDAYASLERQVVERTSSLQEVNQALEAYAFTVSHDVRSQLRVMRGYAEALLTDLGNRVSQEHREYLQRLNESATLLYGITDELLEYSRLGKEEIVLKTVSLDSLVDKIVETLATSLDDRQAAVMVEGRPLPTVCASRAILGQVLLNLLNNAVKFVGPDTKPVIRISAEECGDRVRLSVTDNGIGIAQEDQERIFRPLERLHAQDVYPGTGIGLAYVTRSVERMGGTVGLESNPGRGSRFWIDLPTAEVHH